MRKILLLFLFCSFLTSQAQYSDNKILIQTGDALPAKIPVKHPRAGEGPKNYRQAYKSTAATTYSDWYDLWDVTFDTTTTTGYHSYQFVWEINSDSNIYSVSGYYAPYYHFTHGMGMSFDPSDSAYYYFPRDTDYQVSAPFIHTLPYTLDSFWVPGIYYRYDPNLANVDSLIVEFLVTQNGSAPDSGAYKLIATTPHGMYRPFTRDSTPRFGTARYFRLQNECIDPVLTTTVHQRHAFPLTVFDAFFYRKQKFHLPTPITVPPGKYLVAYVYFKSQAPYPAGTLSSAANYYWLYAGEPYGTSTWYPQSSRNSSIGYAGSHQMGLIATKQIRYNDLGFTFAGHNVLLPASAYANTGANLPPGFSVPHMAFHITWTVDPALGIEQKKQQEPLVQIYPNPATDMLNIAYSLGESSNVKILLVDAVGRVAGVYERSDVSGGEAVFNTAGMPAGVYVYLLEAGGLRKTGKVVIRR
ncbi:MAG: hypothetical protein K0Q79_962 [Flavipsychrobacter sp.]|jgi:hypothetical protein|nr:hypothetical protein [Flavipsychrobacter sp.]